MKIIITVLVVIAIVVGIVLIVALFVKKDYSVEREITINKPGQEVFNYVKYLKNQNKYSKWATMDPNMKTEFTGADGTVGFISAWDSNEKNVGKGEQEIKKISEGERIDYEIRFIKPFAAVADAYMITESLSSGNQTIVKWGFKSKMIYPMNIMLLCVDMNKMIGDDLDTGLANLKSILEK
jgi:hypothetical protein